MAPNLTLSSFRSLAVMDVPAASRVKLAAVVPSKMNGNAASNWYLTKISRLMRKLALLSAASITAGNWFGKPVESRSLVMASTPKMLLSSLFWSV
ncbi:hypothetical protein D3C81_836510 [compost metagenome]